MSTSLFYRLNTDQQATPVALEDLYAGPQPSACWLIGGGPSLKELPCDAIAVSPLPKMGINLAGAGKLRPTFWTSYDPTVRFHRSVYLDPGVMKFVQRRRAMDLVPETTFKVCECPATFFFDRAGGRGFQDFLSPKSAGIIDWADSMVQGIDILYRLGFRRLYLAGCDMRIQPSAAHLARTAALGLTQRTWHSLSDFLKGCQDHGIPRTELASLDAAEAYHFDEVKSLDATAQTDGHYFRIAQCLRLSRQCLARQGMELISVTPGSRLNDYFPYMTVEAALEQIHHSVGNPLTETTRGLYSQQTPRWSTDLQPMRDVKPPNWPTAATSPKPPPSVKPVDPELAIDGEGWIAAGRPFGEAYVRPDEVG